MAVWTRRGVCFGLLVYAACQWGFLRTINHCSLVNRRRGSELAEFHAFTSALGVEIGAACASGQVRRVLLTDGDVASPYLLGRMAGSPSCEVVRETVVTPFDRAELEGCGSLVVVERHLPHTATGEDGPPEPLRLAAAWRSAGGHFGFDAYRNQRCPIVPGAQG